jgi:predicted lipid-binding transport protein (Tim44 family)
MRTKNAVWLSLALIGALALAPSLADARAGSGKSSGSRGERSHSAPPTTQTAPQAAKPVERSQAQPGMQRQAQPAAPMQQPGFFQRNPFLGGLIGGMVGAGLIGMLMGGGFMGGLGSMAGMLGMLLQVALIGGLIYLAYSFWRRRQQPATEQAGAGSGYGSPMQSGGYEAPVERSGSGLPPVRPLDLGGSSSPMPAPQAPQVASARTDEIGIRDADYQEFERLLADVQVAYSKGDVGKLRQLATPEMVGYFTEDLTANAGKGVENHVADIRLEQGDLAEAWREGDVEYATVAMRFSMLDYATRDGRVVEGSDKDRIEATEIWTMLRHRGGRWTLSAIQQA